MLYLRSRDGALASLGNVSGLSKRSCRCERHAHGTGVVIIDLLLLDMLHHAPLVLWIHRVCGVAALLASPCA